MPESTGNSPCTCTQRVLLPCTGLEALKSPPMSGQLCSRATCASPLLKLPNQSSSAAGKHSPRVKHSGLAPMAARSLKFTKRVRLPSKYGSASGRKCTPSCRISIDIASCMPVAGRSNAQSSPIPKPTSGIGNAISPELKKRRIMSNSSDANVADLRDYC